MTQQTRPQSAQIDATTDVSRRSNTSVHVVPYLLIAPAFIVMMSVIIYPVLSNVWASFIGEETLTRPSEFVGFRHYEAVLNDPVFWPALRRTLIWAFGLTVMQFSLGLFLALLLNGAFIGRSVVRSFAIIPWIMPGIVVAIVWRILYASDFGLINLTLKAIGLESLTQAWLTNLSTVMPAVMVVGAWKGFGFYMVMLLAGLQGIPNDVIEAARLDGADRFQMLRDITLPLLRPVILMSVVLGLIWTSNYFEAIYILTGGGPARATETLPIFIYNTAFQFYRLNEAIASAIILLLFVLLLVGVYLYLFLRMNKQEDVL